MKENKRSIAELLLADSRSDLDTKDSYEWKEGDVTKFGRSLEEAARYWDESKVQQTLRYSILFWRRFSMSFFAGTLVSQDTPNAHVGVGMDIS